MRGARCAALVLCCGLSMGNDCFPAGSATDGGGYVGPGAPSVQVTVDGTHVGPYAAAATAFADLTTTRDDFGRRIATGLKLHAEGGIASCDLELSRYGPEVSPFSALPYRLETLTCSGGDCGGSLVVTILDAMHVEGYLAATMADPSDGQRSSVVCTFYVPWRTYQP
jgi:hypothetical protein